jgi:hypothetical protein
MSRTRSRPRGAASPKWTASTSWSCGPGSPGGRWWCCGRTRSTCARPGRSTRRSTWSPPSPPTPRWRPTWCGCSRPASTPARTSTRPSARRAPTNWRPTSAAGSTTSPPSTATASCGPTCH